MSTWTAFPTSAVRFLGDAPRYFASNPIAERGFCPKCGASLTYTFIRARPTAFLIMFTLTLDESEGHAPAAHSRVESQMPWLEIMDDLPRTRTAGSRVLQEARSSVGLPDPDTWEALAKPPKVF